MKNEEIQTQTFGYFQVTAQHAKPPISYTISLEEDEEQIIMQNFRVASNSKEKVNFPDCGQGDGSSLYANQASTLSNFTRSNSLSYTTRSDCYPSDAKFSYQNSAFEVFKNVKTSLDSSLANFTALSPSQIELSPPENQLIIPSNAHRVKFTPVYDCDSKIPAQMEALGDFNSMDLEESNSNEENVNLSRMPVTCPISTCCTSSLPSNFYNHIVNDHPYIKIVKLLTCKLSNFKICPAGNLIMCHRMFLVNSNYKLKLKLTKILNRLKENYKTLAMELMKIAFQ